MLQHMLHMLINDRKLSGRVATQLLKMWAVVTGIDTVRNDVGAANVKFRAGKYIRASTNKFLSTALLIEGEIIGQTTQQTLNVVQLALASTVAEETEEARRTVPSAGTGSSDKLGGAGNEGSLNNWETQKGLLLSVDMLAVSVSARQTQDWFSHAQKRISRQSLVLRRIVQNTGN